MDRGLLFAGQAGVGKTHLAVGIVRELLLRFHDDILFVDFPTLLASTRETEWERSRKVSLLLVDNFGLAKPSSHNVCATEQLLRSRTDTGNCTILTGDRVSLRYLFGAGGDALQSPTQELLRSLSPGLLLSFLGRTRIVSMVGDDYRAAHALSKSLLFP